VNILVLVKPSAESSNISFKKDMTLNRQANKLILDMADAHALALARTMKKMAGGTITVLTLAPGYPSRLIEQLQSQDTDALYHICDSAFAGGDCLATAAVLAAAVRYIEKKQETLFDLILTGSRSTDAETGQVPGETAAILSVPVITNVQDIAYVKGKMLFSRVLEDCVQELSCPDCCVVSCTPKGFELAPPSLAGLARASLVPYIKLTNTELKIPAASIGFRGSPTRVIQCSLKMQQWRKPRWIFNAKEGASIIRIETAKCKKHAPVQSQPLLTRGAGDDTLYVLCPLDDSTGWYTALEILSHLTVLGKSARAAAFGKRLDTDRIEELNTAGAYAVDYISIDWNTDDALTGICLARYLQDKSGIVLCASSIRMRAAVPVCAALLHAGITADCTGIAFSDQGFIQSRPAFGGTTQADIISKGKLCFSTIRPHVYSFSAVKPVKSLPVFNINGNYTSRIILEKQSPIEQINSEDIPVIFSIGAGVKDPEYRKRIESFGLPMGASRKAVNLFGLPYAWQVGQTGRIVHCDLYVAFGISGAEQHISGISSVQKIIAVNNDRSAPVFSYSDVAVCCDIEDVVTALERDS